MGDEWGIRSVARQEQTGYHHHWRSAESVGPDRYRGQNQAGDPSWWLYAGNNEKVAWAGETFASTYNASRAASAFKAGAKTARYEVYPATGGSWRWRAWRSSDKVASSGESFSSKLAAEQAANRVRDNAGSASGA